MKIITMASLAYDSYNENAACVCVRCVQALHRSTKCTREFMMFIFISKQKTYDCQQWQRTKVEKEAAATTIRYWNYV